MFRRQINLDPYHDINNSAWFQDIIENACEHSERQQNRIFVYFKTEEDYKDAVKRCEARNIHYIGPIHNTFYETWRLDIFMNWKTRTPSKLHRKQEQKLN